MALLARITVGHMAYSESGDDGFGNPVGSWAAAVDVEVYGLGPDLSLEASESGRDSATVPWSVLGPTSVVGAFDYRDRLTFQGVTYELSGEPEVFDFGPFGFEPGARTRIVRVRG